MRRLIVFIQLLLGVTVFAQETETEWYILEKGSTVGVIKPGVNDLTYQLASSGNKPIDKDAVNAMIERISYKPGSLVLIHAIANDTYIAIDIEGRNIIVKGGVTKVERGNGSGVGYMKESITVNGITLKKEQFVWIKEHKAGDNNAVIQCAGKKSVVVPFSKLFDVNTTTIEMGNTTKMKKVE